MGRNEYVHHGERRGKGLDTRGKIRGDNAGKGRLPAGVRCRLLAG